MTTGEPIRVPVADIIEIGTKPPRAGRLSLTLKYRAGLDKVGKSWWVEQSNEDALNALVSEVEAARSCAGRTTPVSWCCPLDADPRSLTSSWVVWCSHRIVTPRVARAVGLVIVSAAPMTLSARVNVTRRLA